jgi:DNA-directed RNA polymerase subunit RPC12/RpoP
MAGELLCLEVACDYCGARLEVTAAEVGGEPRAHTYLCAQCGKNHDVMTTGNPHVRVLAPRTDGRTSQYAQTMF